MDLLIRLERIPQETTQVEEEKLKWEQRFYFRILSQTFVHDRSESVDQDQYVGQFEHNEMGIAPGKRRVSDVESFFEVQESRPG